MVGHNLELIKRLSRRVLWMHDGWLRADGAPEDVIGAYQREAEQHRGQHRRRRVSVAAFV